MTPQEAIDILINLEHSLDEYSGLNETGKTVFRMAAEALEKQIPKRPIRIDKNGTFDGNWVKVCPTCKEVLVERITTEDKSISIPHNLSSICRCGQILDRG